MSRLDGNGLAHLWQKTKDYTDSKGYQTAGDVSAYIEAHKEELKGTTPVRGTDYWTAADIASIKAYVDEAILGGEW